MLSIIFLDFSLDWFTEFTHWCYIFMHDALTDQLSVTIIDNNKLYYE